MTQIHGLSGVRLQLLVDGHEVVPQPTGFVGLLEKGQQVRLVVSVEPLANRKILALDIDGAKNVHVMNNHANILDQIMGRAHFETGIQIKFADYQPFVTHTEYPDNHIRLLEIWDNGLVKLWEISLVSQYGKFFLIAQWTYQVQCYQNQGTTICPYWEIEKKWNGGRGIVPIIKANLPINQLPPFSNYRLPSTYTHQPLGPDKGIVNWWNCAQGIGELQTAFGRALLHWANISAPGRQFIFLTGGEHVTIGSFRQRERVNNPSISDLEACDVSVAAE